MSNKEYNRIYNQTEKRKASKRAWNREHSKEIKARNKVYYQENKDKLKAYTLSHNKRNREKVFDHYGRRCNCCGETGIQFLTIDHVNNDGSLYRKETGLGSSFYRWLIKNDFPEGFQTLCMNCNFAKGKTNEGGICPHQKETYMDRIGW